MHEIDFVKFGTKRVLIFFNFYKKKIKLKKKIKGKLII